MMLMHKNPKETDIRKFRGTYRFFIIDIPSSTFRIVARYYKDKRKLDAMFAIEMFYTLDHPLIKYNLRLFVPRNANTIIIEYEDKIGNVLDSDRFELE